MLCCFILPYFSSSPLCFCGVLPKKKTKKKNIAPENQLDTRKHSFHIFNWFVNLSFTKKYTFKCTSSTQLCTCFKCVWVLGVCVCWEGVNLWHSSQHFRKNNNNKMHDYSHPIISWCISISRRRSEPHRIPAVSASLAQTSDTHLQKYRCNLQKYQIKSH